MANTGTGDGTVVVKQEPTSATYKRSTTVGVGGVASTTGLTLGVAYLFTLYAGTHPGFQTPVEVMGEAAGAAVYAFIAGAITGAWQFAASFIIRGTKIILHEEDDAQHG